MKLKVCGMRDPDNIRDLVEVVQPDWMGLIFYPPSPRFVENALAESIRNFRVNKVGVFVNASMEEISEKVGLFGLDAIQLHGDESPEFANMLKEKTGKSVWKVFLVGEEMDWKRLLPYQNVVDCFLFDTFSKSHGGSGRTFNWDLLLDYPLSTPFMLSGGLAIEHAEAIKDLQARIPQMQGIDINSKFETKPGVKDISLVRKFWDYLKT
ncbi:phosphoribosylanthranilate isomerase [Mariniradius sediminis]|uniref:N-(5'-phosphoribosyl)anthranilate isomerase n=1 Tax=Mariniradius sediminis TaxID=2909237 RepID=A0ABS9BYY4_9BACT|nr:phosphoribosylanthranilate isomerase [Mariniradius sediminis]MCF1753283.1 phosphoribosylanthranilate isomerase [Mariniradius sediminis]